MDFDFKVRYEVEYLGEDEYGNSLMILADAVPESLTMVCPYCELISSMSLDAAVNRSEWKDEPVMITMAAPIPVSFDLICSCPFCKKPIFAQAHIQYCGFGEPAETNIILRYPRNPESTDIPPEIPAGYRDDFREAKLVLELSPKASAALSRRTLQRTLREEFGIKHRSLAAEIEEFTLLKEVPSKLADAIDAVRNVGNFAAHPLKDMNTGEIVDVEPGEAEWLLDVLGILLDFTFVKPKRIEERKRRLNEKLIAMGKPPMKD